jgi:hypothetical protein
MGESVGHPFRGNQWTEGSAGASESTSNVIVQRGDYMSPKIAEGPAVPKVPKGSALVQPLKGRVPGTAIIGYEWQSKIEDVDSGTDAGVVAKRVSDWDRSGFSTGTGREIVHHFYVKHPDGSVTLEGVRSAEKILGGIEDRPRLSGMTSAVKTARGWEQKIKEAEDSIRTGEAVKAEVEKLPPPPVVQVPGGWGMGDAEVWSVSPEVRAGKLSSGDIPEERRLALVSAWQRKQADARGVNLMRLSSTHQYLRDYKESLKKAMKKVHMYLESK